MKKILLVPLFLWLTAFLAVSKESQTDSTFTFRFIAGNDMFYTPWNGNGAELERLLECVEDNIEDIQNGALPIYVEGHCDSGSSKSESLKIAKLRSNRVKSELIMQKGLKEACFITRNSTLKGNCVVVRICSRTVTDSICPPTETKYKSSMTDEESRTITDCPTTPAVDETDIELEEESVTFKQQSTEPNDSTSIIMEEPIKPEVSPAPIPTKEKTAHTFYLRTNLLHMLTLTPDIGIEWRSNSGWGLLLNVAWTNWTWKGIDKRYALWEVSPEVRYYLGTSKIAYIGANARIGQFNYKFDNTGKQGDLLGAGVTCGYILHLTSSLCLDFSIGAGYTHVGYDKYAVIENTRVRKGNEDKGIWGVNNIGISLVWNID